MKFILVFFAGWFMGSIFAAPFVAAILKRARIRHEYEEELRLIENGLD